jgi:hypothetical protein
VRLDWGRSMFAFWFGTPVLRAARCRCWRSHLCGKLTAGYSSMNTISNQNQNPIGRHVPCRLVADTVLPLGNAVLPACHLASGRVEAWQMTRWVMSLQRTVTGLPQLGTPANQRS